MNKINKDWKEVKLGDIVDITMGQSPKSQFYNKINKGMPFLQGSSTFGHLYPSFEIYSSDIKKIAVNGSILMSVRAPVGDLNMANTDICIGRGLCSINGKNKSLNRYIFYLLNYYKSKIVNIQTGTVFGAISKDNILNFKVSIPQSEKEQKRIASILSALDDKIELNNKTNKILEEMAQTIFKEWFINFNFPNEDGKPYKKSGGEMIDSELGKIPKGWKVITLKDIISIAKGKKPNATSDKITEKFTMPYLTINCYNNEATEYTEYNEKMHVKELDIVMVMDGNAGKIFYGKEGILSSTMAKLIVEDSNLNELVFYFLKSIEYDLMYHTVGSVIQHADKQYMLNKKFCVSLDNLERLSDIFKCIRKEISLNKKENEKLSNIRDSLLPKLMTPKGRRADGEIRV
ncbi:restriction modification system DNA specificity domain protein [Brachyspira sp. CAG:700]|nr:restriction endonuclease subunit S [Brachyspira sp.]CCY78291.1 restriction modification system DNA specificity domain protein [Brachyspira sp. CAG:700]